MNKYLVYFKHGINRDKVQTEAENEKQAEQKGMSLAEFYHPNDICIFKKVKKVI